MTQSSSRDSAVVSHQTGGRVTCEGEEEEEEEQDEGEEGEDAPGKEGGHVNVGAGLSLIFTLSQ